MQERDWQGRSRIFTKLHPSKMFGPRRCPSSSPCISSQAHDPQSQAKENAWGSERKGTDTRSLTPKGTNTFLAMALNWSLRNEPLAQENQLIWTLWQINVDSVSLPHQDGNNLGRSFITALGEFTGGEFVIQGQELQM